MRFLGQRRKLCLRQAGILDMKLDGKAETAASARTDADVGRDFGFRRVLLLLLRHEIERPAETRGVAGREQMLGVVVWGFPGPPMALGTERSAFTEPSLASV